MASTIIYTPSTTTATISSSNHSTFPKFSSFCKLNNNNNAKIITSSRTCLVFGKTLRISHQRLFAQRKKSGVIVTCSALPSALLFDCDGVLVDTERDGHRVSFNDTFTEKGLGVSWDVDLYGELLKIGGGKERHDGRKRLHPAMQNGKNLSLLYTNARLSCLWLSLRKKLLPLRPGVAKLIDQALSKGVKVAVCSTSNEKAVSAIVSCLLGPDRAAKMQIFAGDVVPRKKPDPAIYILAATTLGVDPASCVVVEDSAIGLAAAKAAGMKCIVTKSGYTADEDFENADAVFDCIGDPPQERFDLDFCGSLLTKQFA